MRDAEGPRSYRPRATYRKGPVCATAHDQPSATHWPPWQTSPANTHTVYAEFLWGPAEKGDPFLPPSLWAAQGYPQDADWLASLGAPHRPPRCGAPLQPFLGHARQAGRAISRLARPLLVPHQRASFKRPAARSWLAATHQRRGGCGAGRRAAVAVLLRCSGGAAGQYGCFCVRPTSGSTEPLTASVELYRLKERARDLSAAETRVRKDRPRSARITRRLRSGVCVSASAFRIGPREDNRRTTERLVLRRYSGCPCGMAFPSSPSARLQRNSALREPSPMS